MRTAESINADAAVQDVIPGNPLPVKDLARVVVAVVEISCLLNLASETSPQQFSQ